MLRDLRLRFMSSTIHQPGETIDLQFVWQIPIGDYVRAIFRCTIVSLDRVADRYIIQLDTLLAARQEDNGGEGRLQNEYDEESWQLVNELVGRKAAVAFEAADGRPLRLRYQTLTREHRFFTRFD